MLEAAWHPANNDGACFVRAEKPHWIEGPNGDAYWQGPSFPQPDVAEGVAGNFHMHKAVVHKILHTQL